MEKEHLYRYFSGAASEDERHEIRRWVEASDENRNRFMDERKFYDIVSLLEADESAPAAAVGPRRGRGWLRVFTAAAAAAAIAVVATLGVQAVLQTQMAEAVLPMQQITVPAGQRISLVLADGTAVWLNSNSTMRFPGAFTGGERRVEIDGEAYFAVAKDASKPFTVTTVRGDVRVTGTKFNVDAYSASSDFAVSLVEGSVSFAAGDRVYDLTPGKRLTATSGGAFVTGAMDPETLEWVNGIISFRQLPMDEILARFEKYYGVSVEMRRPDLAKERFSGKFYLDEGIEQALNTLRHDVRFEYESDKDNRHIIIK